jgi:outer membrane protein assembly factor BamB
MKNFWRLSVGVLPCILAGAVFAADAAPSWPTFRGLHRTAVAPDTGLLQEWPEGGPKLLWEAPGVGRGYSSLAIVDGKIFTLGDGSSLAEDMDEYLHCYSAEDGKPIWKTKTGAAWTSGRSPSWKGSRSTPTVDGPRVYVLTPHGDLVCCDVATGAEKWRKNLQKDFDGKKGDSWGYGESVTIDGDKLVCTPGNEKNTMVALNKENGELIWSCSQMGNGGAGHASIVMSEIGGTRVYVQTTATGVIGVRATDGKLLWNYDIRRTTAVIPTPIVRGDLVFFTAGYGTGGALLKQVPAENNEVKVEEVWPMTNRVANKHGGMVLVGDYVYGDSEDSGNPFCADLMTGAQKWKKRGSGRGSAAIAAADGCLYLHFADGTMVLAKATPEDYTEVGKFKVPHSGEGDHPSWSHPVIFNGKMFVKEFDHILCYDVTAK